jgi:hypothetical protein
MLSKSSHSLRLAGIVLGLTLIVSILVLVIGYIYDWHEAVRFSNAFFAAGGILIVLGTLSIAGGFLQRADFKMSYSESAGQANIAERSQRMISDIAQRYGAMILLVSVGVLLMIISVLVGQFPV